MNPSDALAPVWPVPAWQQALHARCYLAGGTFTPFEAAALDQPIPHRFEQQVRRHPGRLAVADGRAALTYEALNRRANAIAHALLARRGAAPEPVALLLDNEAPMVAAMLGVLKAGKSFAPLDPTYPKARTAYLLRDLRAGMLLTQSRYQGLARELGDEALPVLDLDHLGNPFSEQNPALPFTPDLPAYILYTSGSTGEPKGVVQNHRGLLHDAMNWTNGVHVCPEDRLLLPTAYTQLGVQLFGAALFNGASLHPFEVRTAGMEALAGWLNQQRITLFRTTATYFRHFVQALVGPVAFPHLRLIRLGGEPVYRRDWALYRQHFPDTCLFCNALATTETGTITLYLLDRQTPVEGLRVPVGYPVPGLSVHLLDEAGQPVAPGAVGRIVVEGEHHALGYWHRPTQTDAHFHPGTGNARRYDTGDLGCLHADGALEHLGREDFQLKLRGYRVEPAEVELALLGLDNVREAVVHTWTDAAGEVRLAAYLVPFARPAPTPDALRQALADVLPAPMVPAAFVVLDALPQTPNGKVDRRALPAPGRLRPALKTAYAAPRTPVEARLAEIWAGVLELEQVGVDDAFLDLGGNSLLAVQVLARVLHTFGVELPARLLFEQPTVATMATVIVQHPVASPVLPPAGPVDPGEEVPEALASDPERLRSYLEALPDEMVEALLKRMDS
jgi:amino acid adenylation domain-containing protein